MISGAITSLVITLRFAWPALVLLGAISSLGFLSLAGHPFPPLRSFAVLFLPLLILCAWGGGNWAAEEGAVPSHWRSNVLDAIGLLSVGLAIAVPWLHRKSPRWWVLIPASLASLALTLGAWFVGSMAIANVWL
jgi:hypothetical protein